ncbi:MAG: hypothetical protein ACRDHK_05810, partial [Actinomycetota bacterium]
MGRGPHAPHVRPRRPSRLAVALLFVASAFSLTIGTVEEADAQNAALILFPLPTVVDTSPLPILASPYDVDDWETSICALITPTGMCGGWLGDSLDINYRLTNEATGLFWDPTASNFCGPDAFYPVDPSLSLTLTEMFEALWFVDFPFSNFSVAGATADGEYTFQILTSDGLILDTVTFEIIGGATTACGGGGGAPDGDDPVTTIAFPGNGVTFRRQQDWDQGSTSTCSSSNPVLCGTSTDPTSNISELNWQMKRNGNSTWWDGDGFDSTTAFTNTIMTDPPPAKT